MRPKTPWFGRGCVRVVPSSSFCFTVKLFFASCAATDALEHREIERARAQHELRGVQWVLLDLSALFGAQHTTFFNERGVEADDANVVKERGLAEVEKSIARKRKLGANDERDEAMC